jgi:hypothetical protein
MLLHNLFWDASQMRGIMYLLVLAFSNAHKVFNTVVKRISIDVVNVATFGNVSVIVFPQVSVIYSLIIFAVLLPLAIEVVRVFSVRISLVYPAVKFD